MSLLAQLSHQDDILFRIVLIPAGLVLVAIGLHAASKRELHFRKRRPPLQGSQAVALGLLVAALGAIFTVAALMSFLRFDRQPDPKISPLAVPKSAD